MSCCHDNIFFEFYRARSSSKNHLRFYTRMQCSKVLEQVFCPVHLCKARENMQPVRSAGKHATGTKGGKMQPVPSAGKHATGEPSAGSKHATSAKSGGRRRGGMGVHVISYIFSRSLTLVTSRKEDHVILNTRKQRCQ